MKKYFVIDIEWSASDIDTVIIYAESKEKALERIKASGNSPRYVSVVRTVESLITL